MTRTTAPLAISHQAQFPAVALSFNLAPDAALGDAVEKVRAIESRIGMPSSIVGLFAGDAAEFSKSLAGQPWLLRLHAKESGIPYGIALAIGALMIYPETECVKAVDLAHFALR